MINNGAKLIMLLTAFTFLIGGCIKKRTDSLHSKRYKVSDYSRKFVGSKYKYAGKTPKGFDCSGFTRYVMHNFSVPLSSSSSAQAQQGKKIPVEKVKAGDLIFFGKRKKVTHVGLVLNNTKEGITVIHSTTSSGVIVQNVTQSKYWKPKILFARDVLTK